MRLKGYVAFSKAMQARRANSSRTPTDQTYQPGLGAHLHADPGLLNRADEGEKLGYDMLAKNPARCRFTTLCLCSTCGPSDCRMPKDILKSKVEKNPKVADPYLQLAAHYYSMKARPEMMAVLQRLSANQTDFPQGD